MQTNPIVQRVIHVSLVPRPRAPPGQGWKTSFLYHVPTTYLALMRYIYKGYALMKVSRNAFQLLSVCNAIYILSMGVRLSSLIADASTSLVCTYRNNLASATFSSAPATFTVSQADPTK